MSEEQKKEKLSELRKKEQEIQDILAKKTKELKKICLREAVRETILDDTSSALALFFARHNVVPARVVKGLFCAFRSSLASCQRSIPSLQVKDHHMSDGELALLSN